MAARLRRTFNGLLSKLERGHRSRILSGPTSAIIHVNDSCTFRCAMCMNTSSPIEWPREGVHQQSGSFGIENLKQLLSAWPTLRAVCFAGVGEPLLSQDIGEMVTTAHAAGLKTELVTNGTEIAGHFEWLTSGVLDKLSISLNAWDDESARRYCGVSGVLVDRMREAVRLLGGESNRGRHLPAVEMSSVLWKGRETEARQIIAFVSSAGVRKVSFHNLIPSSLDGFGVDRVLTVEDIGWLEKLQAESEAAGIEVELPGLLDPESPSRVCSSAWRTIYVDASGGVSGCFRVEVPSSDHGDWRDPTCWNNEYFTGLREAHMRRKDDALPERCRVCVEVHGIEL